MTERDGPFPIRATLAVMTLVVAGTLGTALPVHGTRGNAATTDNAPLDPGYGVGLVKAGVHLAFTVANCLADEAAVPVHSFGRPTTGNGGMFFMNPSGNLYAAWWMTSEMDMGVDDWVFAAEASNGGGTVRGKWESDSRSSTDCQYIGNLHVEEFGYEVVAGGMGNTGSSSCTGKTWWKNSIGASVGVTVKGPKGSVMGSHTWGGSTSCTESSSYDSESLIEESGDSTLPPSLAAVDRTDERAMSS